MKEEYAKNDPDDKKNVAHLSELSNVVEMLRKTKLDSPPSSSTSTSPTIKSNLNTNSPPNFAEMLRTQKGLLKTSPSLSTSTSNPTSANLDTGKQASSNPYNNTNGRQNLFVNIRKGISLRKTPIKQKTLELSPEQTAIKARRAGIAGNNKEEETITEPSNW